MKKKIKNRILIVLAVIVLAVVLRFFVVWFVGLFDNVKRHGIAGPGSQTSSPVSPGK